MHERYPEQSDVARVTDDTATHGAPATSALHDERDRRAAVLGDKAMLTDLIVFRAAMTRPGDLAKPNGGRK